MKQRTLGFRPVIGAVVATEIIVIATWLITPLWEIATIAATVTLVLLTVTVHRRSAAGWVYTVARWRRNRRHPSVIPAAVDVTAGDMICGVRIDGYEAIAAIKLAGRPHRPTYLHGAAAITDDTIPLRILADHLKQPGGLRLSIDVVSEGRRVRRSSGYPALYSTLLANRPAAGQRATHLIVRLDLTASTGLGYRASIGAALAAATERITSALKQSGCRAAVMTAAELDSHLTGNMLGERHNMPSGDILCGAKQHALGAALRWGAVKTRDGYAATYYHTPQDINTATLTRMWALNVEAINSTVALRYTDGMLEVAAMARVLTAQPPTQPPTLDLNPLPGDQYAALQWSTPTARSRLAMPWRTLTDPDDLTLPIGPCGVLIGAATHDAPGVRTGDFVTLPLTDPVTTTRIAMDVEDVYVRAILARAAAVGERIIIHTNTTDAWAGLNDPNIALAQDGRAKFVPTIIVNDHAVTTPAQGLASTLITLGLGDADIMFSATGDTVQVKTAVAMIDVEPVTFLREQTWTG